MLKILPSPFLHLPLLGVYLYPTGLVHVFVISQLMYVLCFEALPKRYTLQTRFQFAFSFNIVEINLHLLPAPPPQALAA